MIKSVKFIISNTDFRKCPSPDKPEFAFIGRSNVGKSSLINMLANNKGLAKISGTPGKTQLINHFDVDGRWYMVDLPGYGFAKVSKTMREEWEKMIRQYLTLRENLEVVFVLVDSRHTPQQIDVEFIYWCGQNGIPVALLFTKADKQSKSKTSLNVKKFLDKMLELFEEVPDYFVTSAETSMGREDVISYIQEQVSDFYQNNQQS
ncbi:ribosome biogenesis GTP-binding protein YihA/YsxC [Pleomorphovibrio marinus]|uniref:ribosome biogenesis GTP-binding protein YihA/YsxC n=1 Tax=Pleomorphovibrio marinus TaxID=2164132 RepID=UPI000E09F2CB|nr:ribosome biogenesis GTP-binding protein YihA/YsxC [Pleomorphovibrio marinus]